MTDPRVETPYGDPPPPVCPRCARRVDMEAIGPQVGLCHCLSCQRYACRWCWLKARGKCPMCAAPYEVWGAAGAPVVAARPRRRRRKLDRRAAAILLAMIAILSVVSLTAIGWLGSVGGAESRATARPVAGSPTGPGSSLANAGDPTTSAGASGAPSGDPSDQPGESGRSNPTPAPGKETAAPAVTAAPTSAPTAAATPHPTPGPTPRPTPAPTPAPTPRPTPAPTPTPCVTVPNLVGKTVADARATWTSDGFSGAFSPAGKGRDAWIVDDQTQTAGACIPPTSAISVHSHKP